MERVMDDFKMAVAPVPDEISKRVAKLSKKGWPAMVEFPQGRKRLWITIQEATVAQLEQAVELEIRRARAAILRFSRTGSKAAAGTAAMSINRARSFKDWSLQSQGVEVSEAVLPFPCMSPSEMKDHLDKERSA
jgi:hypothetical protein